MRGRRGRYRCEYRARLDAIRADRVPAEPIGETHATPSTAPRASGILDCTGFPYDNKRWGGVMDATTVSYTEAREPLAELWDRVTEERAPIRLTRRGAPPVVLLAEEEYQGL